MSIIRLGMFLAVIVAILPSDPNARSELALKAAYAGQETATFCQRNPHTCGVGQELWSAFLQKAQYGLTLAGQFASSYADRSSHDRASRNYPTSNERMPPSANSPYGVAPPALEPRPEWPRPPGSRERI